MEEVRDPRDVFKDWVVNRGCSLTWVAEKTGWSREMISYVYNKKRTMSKKLALDLRTKLEIPLEWRADQPIVDPNPQEPTPTG